MFPCRLLLHADLQVPLPTLGVKFKEFPGSRSRACSRLSNSFSGPCIQCTCFLKFPPVSSLFCPISGDPTPSQDGLPFSPASSHELPQEDKRRLLLCPPKPGVRDCPSSSVTAAGDPMLKATLRLQGGKSFTQNRAPNSLFTTRRDLW